MFPNTVDTPCGKIFFLCHVENRTVPISQVFDDPLTVPNSGFCVYENGKILQHDGRPDSDSWWTGDPGQAANGQPTHSKYGFDIALQYPHLEDLQVYSR